MAINYVDPRSIRPVTERLTGEALEAIKDAVEGITGLPPFLETGKYTLVVEDGALSWEEVVN